MITLSSALIIATLIAFLLGTLIGTFLRMRSFLVISLDLILAAIYFFYLGAQSEDPNNSIGGVGVICILLALGSGFLGVVAGQVGDK